MAHLPRVSVIVPFLNEERWLELLIRALQGQTFPRDEAEFLFVDNGSTDRSLEILERHPWVTILHETIRDPYIARNRAIQYARAELLVFLDADCIPDPDWLANLVDSMERNGTPIALGYLANPRPASRVLRAYEDYYDEKLRYLIAKGLERCYFGHAGNMGIRAEVFQKFGLFPAMPVVGDTEIIHRLHGQQWEPVLAYAPEARVTHAEVSEYRHCLRKIYETGVYSQTLLEESRFRPVPIVDRLWILWDCGCRRGYSAWDWAAAGAMILTGWLAFASGRLTVALQAKDATRRAAA
jgi:glycosyltransferase involved in cell wall biosynthesis